MQHTRLHFPAPVQHIFAGQVHRTQLLLHRVLGPAQVSPRYYFNYWPNPRTIKTVVRAQPHFFYTDDIFLNDIITKPKVA